MGVKDGGGLGRPLAYARGSERDARGNHGLVTLGDNMDTTNLREVGGSLKLDGRLVVEPRPRLRYTLAELLAVSDYSQPQPPEERDWVDAPAVGDEL